MTSLLQQGLRVLPSGSMYLSRVYLGLTGTFYIRAFAPKYVIIRYMDPRGCKVLSNPKCYPLHPGKTQPASDNYHKDQFRVQGLPKGSYVVLFWGSILEAPKNKTKKELHWSLQVVFRVWD